MQCDVKEINKCTKLLTITVPKEAIDTAYTRFYKEISGSAKVPGFRPGKAPVNILKMHYKNEAREEVLKNLVGEHYYEALKKHTINPLGYPAFDKIDFTDEKLSFTATVDIRPEFTIKKYKGISAKREKITIEEKEITEVINRVKEGYAKFVPVEDRALQLGDYAVCDIVNTIEGEKPEERKNEWVEVQENDMIKGFAKQVVGMNPGETREITVTISDKAQEKVRGKKAVFQVSLKEIKTKQMPEMTPEFLKELGDYQSIEAFKEAISKDIEARKKQEADMKIERALIDQIEKDVKCDLPQSLVDRRLESLIQDACESLQRRGYGEKEIEAQKETMRKNFAEEARRQVKVAFLLDKIAQEEKIESTDADIDERMTTIAKQARQTVEAVREYYEKNDMLDSLRAEIRNQKVIDFIKANAEIKE